MSFRAKISTHLVLYNVLYKNTIDSRRRRISALGPTAISSS